MSKERRDIRVSLDFLDLQVNREKKVTEVFPVLQDLLVPKETLVLLVLQVHLVLLVLQDYMVPQALRELKVHRVKLDQRERLVLLDSLDLLVLLETSYTHFPSRPPLKAEHVETLMPAN